MSLTTKPKVVWMTIFDPMKCTHEQIIAMKMKKITY
jgi:hypothetical protein